MSLTSLLRSIFFVHLAKRMNWRFGCSLGSAFMVLCSVGCGTSSGQTNGNSGNGPLSAVTAGTGLTGGGSSGNVTLAVDNTVARTNANQTFKGNITIDGSNQNGLDFGEVGIAPNNADAASSHFELVGPQMHFRLSRAYCDKRSTTTQTAFDQDNFFCPPNVPDGVVIDDAHPPSTTPNRDFIIAPYQFGMSMTYPGLIEISSDGLSVRGRNLDGPAQVGGMLVVGDNNDLGDIRLTAFSVLDNNGNVDRSQSFVEVTSETFFKDSHGDMLFAVRSPQDGFRFQLLPAQTEELAPGGAYKANTVARIDASGKGFFDGGTQTGGADFAESVSTAGAKASYEPGDVLVIDPQSDRQVALSNAPYSTLVAGIYSTKPGVVATPHRSEDPLLMGEIPMAIVGIVPCKVSTENGPIARGDLLVTSSTPGYAMRGTDKTALPGAILGKALQPLAAGKGKIEVLVTLR